MGHRTSASVKFVACMGGLPGSPSYIGRDRKSNPEHGATRRMVCGENLSTMFLDDAVRDRQSEPDTFADLFGCVERFEDAWQHVRRDSVPRVTDGDDDHPQDWLQNSGNLDATAADLVKRLLGIGDDIEQCLLEEYGIALHLRQFLKLANDLDMRSAPGWGPQRKDTRDDFVDTNRLPHRLSRSGKDEQVADDLCRAIGFAIDDSYIALQRAGQRVRPAEKLEMSEHALQRIVQFVRDASHELSKSRQLFGLRQPRAQLLMLGFELVAGSDGARDELAVRSEHAVQQLDVLDRCSQLSRSLFDDSQQVELGADAEADAFDNKRSESTATSLQRNGHADHERLVVMDDRFDDVGVVVS